MSDQYQYANMTRTERDADYIDRARKLLSQDGTTEKNPPMNAQAISETLINIKTALLWLREI